MASLQSSGSASSSAPTLIPLLACASTKLSVVDISQGKVIAAMSDSLHAKNSSLDQDNVGGIFSALNSSWSDDNQIIVFCQAGSNKIYFAKSDTGQFIKSYTISDEGTTITDVCFDSTNTLVAYGCSNGNVGTLNLKTKKKDIIVTTHQLGFPIISVKFNNNDQFIASASIEGTICVSGIIDTKTLFSFSDQSHVTCMEFSVVKSSILACGYQTGKIIIWDVASQTKKAELLGHTSQCTGLAFSPVNNLLLCSSGMDGKIQFFDIATSKNVKTIYSKDQDVPIPLTSIAFCFDGFTIAVGTIIGRVLINNLKDKAKGQLQIVIQEGKKINSMQFARPLKEGCGKNTSLILGSANQSASPIQLKQAISQIPKPQPALTEVQNTQPQKILMSQIKPGSGNPLLKLQTQQNQGVPPKPSGGGLNTSGGTQSQLGARPQSSTGLQSKHTQPPTANVLSQQPLSQRELDEKTLKYIEEQKIDQSKKRIESELQRMQQEMKAMIPPVIQNVGNEKQEERQKVHKEVNIEQEVEKRLQLRVRQERDKERGEISSDIMEFVGKEFDQKAADFTFQIQQSMNNLHLELIRNFAIQENELRESMEKVVGQNKLRRQELNYLREENQKLRNISY